MLSGTKKASNGLSATASMAVLATLLCAPSAAYAQTADATTTQEEAEETKPLSAQTDPDADSTAEDEPSDVIVTGQRRALRSAQQIKRNADTVVDSITATDIGAFPDKSVAEALQRVPGITVNRFAASSDTAHFSAEPSGVLVRGLPQVRSEFNGRDTFSANSSRGLSWGDISPELMAGVDTYKNQTAELIEGGIAGSINLRTRVPFDAQGQLIQAGVNLLYGDLAKKVTPEFSGFYSNRWETGIGEVGIMGNFAYSKVITQSEGIQYQRAGAFDNAFGAAGPATAYIPSGIAFRDNEYERIRKGFAAAFQWQSRDDKLLLTGQWNRSKYSNIWEERGVQNEFFGLYGTGVRSRYGPITVPLNGTGAFEFDSDGNFQSGTFARPSVGWFGNPSVTWNGYGGTNFAYGSLNEEGEDRFSNCYTWAGPTARRGNNGPLCSSLENPYQGSGDLFSISRYAESYSMTQDFGLNLKWEATDRLRFNFDGQFVDADQQNYDIEIDMATFTTTTADFSGNLPRVEFGDPVNVNNSAGGIANPNNWYLRSVMDHAEDSVGQQYALRADGQYDIGTDWLDSLKFGARWADREQKVNWGAYNWQNVSNTWTEYRNPTAIDPTTGTTCVGAACPVEPNPYWSIDSQPANEFLGYPSGFYTTDQFGQPFHGGNLGTFQFVPFDFLRNRGANLLSRERIGVGDFIPICERNGQVRTGGSRALIEMDDSCFTEEEVTDVSETTKAVYAMLKFGGENARIGGVGISGNIGLRYVNTKNRSKGFLTYPNAAYNAASCPATPLVPGGLTGIATPPPPPQPGQPVMVPFPAYCYLTPEDLAFATIGTGEGRGQATDDTARHNHYLPSFNLRLDLSPKWLLRFAASKAMSRPDIGLLKNVGTFAPQLPQANAPTDPRYIRNAGGDIIGVTPEYTGNSFSPFLKPITAWQFDVSLENYFANVGSFSLALFQKKFDDYIQFGEFRRDVTVEGVTREVLFRGPGNGKGAKLRGFEVAYQRFFDFLPEPLNGLGIQTNFTYVSNKGIKNSNLSSVGSGGGETTNAGTQGSALDPGALEGVSKYSYNLVGMYEKGKLAARLAYNWRSKYLVTAYDCCVYLPVWQKAAGFLDGSIRYAVTNNVELNLRGSNLLNTKTELMQQVTDAESPEGRIVLVPNAYFQNDRRFEIGARVKF
jgi:TonB-dependent receptor